jgi:hypothetical protein
LTGAVCMLFVLTFFFSIRTVLITTQKNICRNNARIMILQ